MLTAIACQVVRCTPYVLKLLASLSEDDLGLCTQNVLALTAIARIGL